MATNKLSLYANLNTSGFKQGMKEMQTGLGKISQQAKGLGRTMTTFVTAPLVAAGAGALKAAGDFEYMEVQLATLTGSAKEGKRVMKELTDFTAKTPFQIEGVQKAAKQLLASGTAVEDLQGQLQYLGDVAAAVGAPIEDLARPLAKVQAQGKLSGEALQMFMDRGINLMPALSQVTGIAMEDLRKSISKGEISAEMLNAALDVMNDTGGIAEGGMLNLSKTLKGQMSTALDNVKIAAAEFGKVLMPIAVEATEKITALAQRFAEMDEGTKKFIVVAGGIAAALGPALLIFGQVAGAVNNLRTLFQGLSLAGAAGGGGIMAALAPVLPIILAVAAAALLIYKNWDKITAYFTNGPGKKVWDSLKATFEEFKTHVMTIFNGLAFFVGEIFNHIMDIVMTVWGFIGPYIMDTIMNAFNFVMGSLDNLFSAFSNIFGAIASIMKGDFASAGAYMVNFFIDVAKQFVNTLGFMAKQAASVVDTILDWFGVDSGLREKADALFTDVTDAMEGWKLQTPEIEEDEEAAVEAGERITAKAQEGADANPVVVTPVIGEGSDLDFSGPSMADAALGNTTDTGKLAKIRDEYKALAEEARAMGDFSMWEEFMGVADAAEGRIESLKTTTQIAAEEMKASFTSILTDGINNLVEGLGVAIGDIIAGTAGFRDLGNEILAAVGGFLSQLGKMYITAGIAKLELDKALLSPPNPASAAKAIAAGAALVAIGGAIKSFVTSGNNTSTGGAGGGTSIPAFAAGGAVMGSTLALIGENPTSRGEAVIPFEKMGQFADMMGINSNNGATHVVVTGNLKGRDIELSGQRGGRQRRRRH